MGISLLYDIRHVLPLLPNLVPSPPNNEFHDTTVTKTLHFCVRICQFVQVIDFYTPVSYTA